MSQRFDAVQHPYLAARPALVCLALLLGFHTPVRGASFTCSGNLTAVEIAICRDQRLSDLDERMASTYFYILKLPGNHTDTLNAQDQWRRRRNSCGPYISCLEAAYADRIGALNREFQGLGVARPPTAATAQLPPRVRRLPLQLAARRPQAPGA